jgi:hypothetical protein
MRIPSDKPVGLVFMCVGLLGLPAALLAFEPIEIFFFFVLLRGRVESPIGPKLLLGAIVVLCCLWSISGLGIFLGKRLGFAVGAVTFGLSTLIGSGAGLLLLGGAAYCLWRLNAFSGPDLSI